MFDRWHIPAAALGPIALFSLLVLLAFGYSPTPRSEIAPPQAIPLFSVPELPRDPSQPLPTAVPLDGNLLTRDDLVIAPAVGLFPPEDEARLAADLDRALDYVSVRFGSGPSGLITAAFSLEVSCGLHGIAYTDQRLMQVFTCPSIPRNRAVNIMAHEFVHQLAHDRYGDRHLFADMILLEGVATWGAGEYWLGGYPNYRSFVRELSRNGALLPLATSYVGRPVSDMNTLYYQWASFVEFLIETYGREPFDTLYVTGSSDPGSSDFLGVYGKPLDALEQEWQVWIQG
ncbi:hypothetical protein HC891_02095 [Candidatus Gracilibacteria bacterium]|nr:hypothetical protein [Candidatus Gracilibacteria bacterium]